MARSSATDSSGVDCDVRKYSFFKLAVEVGTTLLNQETELMIDIFG